MPRAPRGTMRNTQNLTRSSTMRLQPFLKHAATPVNDPLFAHHVPHHLRR